MQTTWFGVVAALSILLSGAGAARPTDLKNRSFAAHVIAVVDGDTVDILVPPQRHVRVRLHGIDTPESAEPFGRKATTFTRVLMFDRDVKIVGKDVDVYGRLVARIFVGETDTSRAILAAGLACTFHRYAVEPLLDAAEAQARRGGLGFWAGGSPQPRCVAREAQTNSHRDTRGQSVEFIGNVSSKVYHAASCRNAACKNCLRHFGSRTEAERAGFRPAGDCLGR